MKYVGVWGQKLIEMCRKGRLKMFQVPSTILFKGIALTYLNDKCFICERVHDQQDFIQDSQDPETPQFRQRALEEGH